MNLVVLAVVVEEPQGVNNVGNRGVVALDAENLVVKLEGRGFPIKVAIDRRHHGIAAFPIDGHGCFSRHRLPGETQGNFQDYRDGKQGARQIRRPMLDLSCGCTKPEMRAESVPQIKAKGKADGSKYPEAPDGASVVEHHAWIARIIASIERPSPDVGAVGDQAGSREELNQAPKRDSSCLKDDQQGKGQKNANERPCPDNEERAGIGRHVGSGNGQWMENDLFDSSTRSDSTENMPKFVNSLHRQPA